MTDTATINLPSATSVDEVLCNKTSDGVNDVVRMPLSNFAGQVVAAIPDGTLATEKFADGSITEVKIADSAVSPAKIKVGSAL